MPEIERDGEELPRLSPVVGCDSTAQGDKVTPRLTVYHMYVIKAKMWAICSDTHQLHYIPKHHFIITIVLTRYLGRNKI